MLRFDKSKNPFLKEKAIAKTHAIERYGGGLTEESMSIQGAINKTLILFAILLVTTYFSYTTPNSIFMYTGVFGGAGVLIFTQFKPHLAPVTGPIFAGLEGLFVGTVSAIYAMQFEGIVFQAVSLTFATLFMMLMIYKTGWIQVTSKFRTGVSMAVGAVMLLYLVSWIGHFVGFDIPFMHDSGPLGIGICLVIIAIASLNLLLDFDTIEKSEQHGAPKYMEWFCAMGLLFTLVWLYMEFLRLLSNLHRD